MTIAVNPKLGVADVPGFRVAALTCGLKRSGRRDLGLITSDTACTAAGMFTAY